MKPTVAITEGIPLPPRAGGIERKYPLVTMDVGTMFFLEGKTVVAFSTYASMMGRRLGRKFRTRSIHMRLDKKKGWVSCEADHPAAVAGVGVWRIA